MFDSLPRERPSESFPVCPSDDNNKIDNTAVIALVILITIVSIATIILPVMIMLPLLLLLLLLLLILWTHRKELMVMII